MGLIDPKGAGYAIEFLDIAARSILWELLLAEVEIPKSSSVGIL
jgi:hypothetical protein